MEDNGTFDNRRLTLLVLRAQSGDREAVDALLKRYQNDVFGYLSGMLRDHNDAEDALQATLMQAVRKLKWLNDPRLFRPWIFRIASRIAYRTLSANQKRQQAIGQADVGEIADEPLDEQQHQDLIDLIPEWLDRLSLKGREAVVLHYMKGFTTEQVAEILNIPVGTAKSRISYSLSCIRRWIEPTKGNS